MDQTNMAQPRGQSAGLCREHGTASLGAWACPACFAELRRWKSTNAPRLEALQGLLEAAQREAAEGAEARATLASERAANARLTDEVDALKLELDATKRAREHTKAENSGLRAALAKANEQAERFERGWYLRGDALEVAVRQNEHDMLMTGEELRACRAALGPNASLSGGHRPSA